MSDNINASRLFNASCFALVTTAMTFAIRAGILGQLGNEFTLTDTQLGWINSMAFLGFPLAMIVGGLLYNFLGAKKLMWTAFASHLLGLILTITAGGFWGLLISTFLIGFANGMVEAGCNPMIADMFPKNQTTMLNKFHVWFPGGIVIGALVSKFMTDTGMGWQMQIGVIMVPTLVYAYLIFGQEFPESKNIETSTSTNLKALFSPLYLFTIVCMTLTATTELGTQQWVERLLGNAGASSMLVLALVTGLMAVGRYFGGPLIHKFKPTGILWGSAIVASVGIFLMSQATGGMTYLAAIVFAIGVCYFWPTMIGFTSEYTAKTGPLGMSLMGGAGMFATSLWQPVIGGWLDSAREEALAGGLNASAAELAAGQSTLGNLVLFPMVLIVLFGILYFWQKNRTDVVAG